MARSAFPARRLALKAVGIFFGIAAVHHVCAILWPAPSDGDSAMRHAAFVGIDASVAVGLFLTPRLFFWFFTALGLQQLHSHGNAFVHEWIVGHRLDWQSLLVLAVVPVTWWLLLIEYRGARK